MKVLGRDKLSDFCIKHPTARSWVRTWLADTEEASWKTSHDIKYRFATASFISSNTVIFNVKGNDYRMVTQVAYKMGVVLVKWIGSHYAYSKINWEPSKHEANRHKD
jgi:mRNA interferase HigB